MGLHSGIDTVAFVTSGAYSETYGASAIANLTNLFCSYGLFEDAPDVGDDEGRVPLPQRTRALGRSRRGAGELYQ